MMKSDDTNNLQRLDILNRVKPDELEKFFKTVLTADNLDNKIKNKISDYLTIINIKSENLDQQYRRQENNMQYFTQKRWNGFNEKAPVFDFNKSENIMTWLDQINNIIENRIRRNETNDEEVAYEIASVLKDAPLNQYLAYMKKCKLDQITPSWIEIQNLLKIKMYRKKVS